ncbi:MAG: excinuclease ABC subunit UvrC, partial [Candidatus Eisenbacteria bacterium]|nr:excinuclease ABC subunit UvrC [Candidatus Eisenbacteria bacterium]
ALSRGLGDVYKRQLYHRFPGLTLTRRVVPDGSRYFGPYTHVKDLRRTLRTLRKVFPLRNCTDRRLERDRRPCLEFHIGRCPAPCTGTLPVESYEPIVSRLIRFLEGNVESVVAEMRSRMLEHAAGLEFEESARLRDEIETLERISIGQRMTPALASDTDVIALVARADRACGVALHAREGRVLGKESRILVRAEGASVPELLRVFVTNVYLGSPVVPDTIVTACPVRDAGLLQDSLSRHAGRQVRLRTARSGPLARLLEAARENAHLRLEEEELRDRERRGKVDPGVYDLQERLDLAQTPYRIEGYDISNLHETHPVASKVVFQDGFPLKGGYRRFRIKQVQGPNDVAMIGEVLERRLRRIREGTEEAPDLILIDGGPGQVGRALEVLEEAGLSGIQILGLAKREERVVVPGSPEPVRLPRNAEGLRLLQRVRDEAHRFAIGYHRNLRGKAQVRSALDPLPGIGPRRRALLLRHFGSVAAIQAATVEDLAKVPGIGPKTAKRLLEMLRQGGEQERAG